MSNTPSCWVISDGRRGIENQALGLAEAAARMRRLDVGVKTLSAGMRFKSLPPGLQFAFKSDPQSYGLCAPYPDIVIGCGRQAIAPLRALKNRTKKNIFTVYIQDPRSDTNQFDLVIAPEHDGISGENVLSMIGSPNRITDDRLNDEKLKFAKSLKLLQAPRAAMLIGGHSKTHKLDKECHTSHIKAAHDILDQGGSLMVTTSRRTPEFAIAAYTELAINNNQVWFWDGTGENPYFAFLAASDVILVTEDSTNMLTEACSTGKPVFTLPMRGKPGKFSKLYAQLSSKCHMKPYHGNIDGAPYPPLQETTRIAKLFWNRYDLHTG
jgi:mitochondrial fission protein ELM1